MKKILISLVPIMTLCLPGLVLAQDKKDLKWLINDIFISGLIRPMVPLLVGLAVVVFIYGVLTTVLAEGGEKKEDGKKFMMWGIVGIFVMVSVWGLVAILSDTFKLDTNAKNTIKMEVPVIRP